MTTDDLLRKLGSETTAAPATVARVAARLRGDGALERLLQRLPGAARGAEARVEARVRRTLGVVERPSAWARWAPAVGTIAVASAMAAAVTAGVVVHGMSRPQPLTGSLTSPVAWTAWSPTPDVALNFEGSGSVGGTDRAPRIDWDSGTLAVEVTPGKGIDLRVSTREAEVRVVGTGFTVKRDAFGSTVEVRHGRVAVRCDGTTDEVLLVAGESRSCAPTSAAGLLGRANALRDSGADGTSVLAAYDAALAVDGNDATQEEVRAARAVELARAGRAKDALADAEAVLAGGGGARRHEMVELAAAQSLRADGCSGALPWLDRLAEDAQASADALAWRTACRADPHAADGLRTVP